MTTTKTETNLDTNPVSEAQAIKDWIALLAEEEKLNKRPPR